MELLVSIIGAFIAIGLTINAFFLKGIYSDMNELKIQMAKIFERGEAKEARLLAVEVNYKELVDRVNKLERGV